MDVLDDSDTIEYEVLLAPGPTEMVYLGHRRPKKSFWRDSLRDLGRDGSRYCLRDIDGSGKRKWFVAEDPGIVLLDVHKALHDLEDEDDPGLTYGSRRNGSIYISRKKSPALVLLKHLPAFLDCYPVTHRPGEHLYAFWSLLKEGGFINDSGFTIFGLLLSCPTEELIIKYNELMFDLQVHFRSSTFKKQVRDRDQGAARNAKSLALQLDCFFEHLDALQVMKVDLGYERHLAKLDFGRPSRDEIAAAEEEIEAVKADFGRFLNNIRSTSWHKYLLGYAWKLSYSRLRGATVHFIAYSSGDSTFSLDAEGKIEAAWARYAKGGSALATGSHDFVVDIKSMGCGLIRKDNIHQMQALYKSVMFLGESDVYLRLKTRKGLDVIGRSDLYLPDVDNRRPGKPAKKKKVKPIAKASLADWEQLVDQNRAMFASAQSERAKKALADKKERRLKRVTRRNHETVLKPLRFANLQWRAETRRSVEAASSVDIQGGGLLAVPVAAGHESLCPSQSSSSAKEYVSDGKPSASIAEAGSERIFELMGRFSFNVHKK